MATSKNSTKPAAESTYSRGKAKADKILKEIEERREASRSANDEGATLPSIIPEALSSAANAAHTKSLRNPPKGDAQRDFFVPALYDVATKDTRSTMDVAIYRLSKKDKRPNAKVRAELTNGYVEIQSGPAGMASVWDYDLILMAVSHLTQAVNLHKAGKGGMPGRVFRPSVAEILKFCRRSDGGRQYIEIDAVLDRLHTTTVNVVRTIKGKGGREKRVNEAEAFITRYKTVADAKTGRMVTVELEIANWIYEEVVVGANPGVLTMHEDYFLIETGLGRFLYRLARLAAGKTVATWNFRTLYERSNSTGTFKEFSRMMREIVARNDLPEYTVAMTDGNDGPKLIMRHRDYCEVIENEAA